MKQKAKAAISVGLMLRKDEQILLMLRQNTGWMDNHWGLPFGYVNKGELPKEAVIREADEELDIMLYTSHLFHVQTTFRINPQSHSKADIYYATTYWAGDPTNMESYACAGLRWYDVNKLPENIVEPHKIAIVCAVKDVFFSEYRESV